MASENTKTKGKSPIITEKPERDSSGRYKPGYSGNPNGRPVNSVSIGDALRKAMDVVIDKRTGLNLADLFVQKTVIDVLLKGKSWDRAKLRSDLLGWEARECLRNLNQSGITLHISQDAIENKL